MDFPSDSSTQTNTALSSTIETSYTYADSSDLSTKPVLLNASASANLLGNGTSITALNYRNITLFDKFTLSLL
jgi:hypothetical protein